VETAGIAAAQNRSKSASALPVMQRCALRGREAKASSFWCRRGSNLLKDMPRIAVRSEGAYPQKYRPRKSNISTISEPLCAVSHGLRRFWTPGDRSPALKCQSARWSRPQRRRRRQSVCAAGRETVH
jgi:hypothetical protein